MPSRCAGKAWTPHGNSLISPEGASKLSNQFVKFRLALWFFLIQCLVCWFVFRDGLWGNSLLAPLDIASTMHSKYKFVDPSAPDLPANHYTIDQFLADLPLQYTMYHSYRRGEIPWWDPYTFSGMPLLADGHSSGTDFVRLILYQLLPFVAAYNWTRILHFILIGLGMLLLLRRWGIRESIALPLSIAYEFAGFYAVNFQHPWLESCFLYYPFLWLAWDANYRQPSMKYSIAGILLVAGILYSGSIQTHTYLAIFGLAFGFGYCGLRIDEWKKVLPCLLLSAAVGACLAAPILFNQVELYFASVRKVSARNPLARLSGIGSITALYPWALGTFRTLDLGKFIGQGYLGFNVFVGSVAALMAACGAFLKPLDSRLCGARKMGIILIGAYFFILSTPLLNVFYIRCGGLTIAAMIVLAAIGAETLIQTGLVYRRSGAFMAALAILIALLTNISALVVYPLLLPRVRNFVREREPANLATMDYAPALRKFQIENLPNEVSFRNPETLISCLGMLGLAGLLVRPSLRRQSAPWILLLSLNALPVLFFAHRYIPRAKEVLWERLLQGGPEQQRVMSKCGRAPTRLTEVSAGARESVFPGAVSHLYAVRVTLGYSSLAPRTLITLPPKEREEYSSLMADWIYETKVRGQTEGTLTPNTTSGLARFHWEGPSSRRFKVRDAGLNEIHLTFDDGEAGKLLWADTYYPGWTAKANGGLLPLKKTKVCLSEIEIPSGNVDVTLRYRPRFLVHGTVMAIVGFVTIGICGIATLRWRRPRQRAQPT